jgi:hypothetical protein
MSLVEVKKPKPRMFKLAEKYKTHYKARAASGEYHKRTYMVGRSALSQGSDRTLGRPYLKHANPVVVTMSPPKYIYYLRRSKLSSDILMFTYNCV